MGVSFKYSSLTSCLTALQAQVDAIVKGQELDDEVAVSTASELAEHASSYRRELCKAEENEKFKQTLKRVAIPLPLAYMTIDMLTHRSLQFNDSLKRELSKTTCIFLELILCQCKVQERSLYSSSHAELYTTLKGMIKTLPEDEVLCRFNLKCCRAALRNLDSFTQRVKKVGKKNITPIGIATVQTILSGNASPPYVNIAPGLSSVLNLVQDVYKSMPEWWYGNVLALKWYGLEVGLYSLKQYKSEKHNGKTIKGKLRDCSSNINLAFYICQIFREVINKPHTEEGLKTELYEDKKLSIVNLATKRPKQDLKNSFWKVRYLALTYIEELIDDPIFNTEASQKAVIYLMSKTSERKIIRRRSYHVCSRLLQVKGRVFLDLFQKCQEENALALGELNQKEIKPPSYGATLRETEKGIRFLERELRKQSRLVKHSTTESVGPSKEQLLGDLVDQQDKYANLLAEKEEFEDRSARSELLKAILDAGNLDGFTIE